jgi:hypothetical protein
MAYGTAEMMAADEYKGLRSGGVALAIIATVGMVVILALNTAGAARIPGGWTALAATGMAVAPVLFLGGKILRRMDDLVEQVAGVRALTAHRDVAHGSEAVELEDPRERRAYANGAVDVLDGRATVVPISGSAALRIAPVQDPRRHL